MFWSMISYSPRCGWSHLALCLGGCGRDGPWRRVVAVGVFIRFTEFTAHMVLTVKPSRGQIYGSFLAFLPGIAGTDGRSVMRGVIENLRTGKIAMTVQLELRPRPAPKTCAWGAAGRRRPELHFWC